MRGQSRSHSLIEALINVAIGYGVSVITTIIVFPLFGLNISLRDNMAIALIFTLVSIIRSYLLRRFFNRITIGR